MNILRTIAEALAPKRIDSESTLAEFLETRASYLVQKSAAEYCQARAGLGYSALLGEAVYRAALERAKWRGYPAALSMVAEAIAGYLRREIPAETAEAWLLGAARGIAGRFPLPEGEASEFWKTALAALAADLGRAALGQPKPAHKIAAARARELFDALPIHAAIRAHDFDMYRNTLRFHLTEICAELEDRADLAALARHLTAK